MRKIYLLSLVPLLLAVGVLAWSWQQIPEIVPTHYGTGLEPDAFAERSFFSVFGLALLALALIGIFAGIGTTCVRIAQKQSAGDRHTIAQAKVNAYAHMADLSLAWLSVAISLGMSLLSLAMVLPGWRSTMPLALVLLLIGPLVITAIVIARTLKVHEEIKRQHRDGELDSEDPALTSARLDDSNYRWGVFYTNPDDPAILVPKRFDLGIDFNYAHPQGRVFMIALIVPTLGLIALAFLL